MGAINKSGSTFKAYNDIRAELLKMAGEILLETVEDWAKERWDNKIKEYQKYMNETEIAWVPMPNDPAGEYSNKLMAQRVYKQQHMGNFKFNEYPISPEELANLHEQRDWDNKTDILVGKISGSSGNLLGIQSNLANVLSTLQAAKQAQLQQTYLNTSGTLQEGIAQETMTTRQVGEVKLGNNLNAMQNRMDELSAYGYDVSGLASDKVRYEELMKAKLAKMEEQARSDMVNDTALTQARLSGDSKQVADAEFNITKTALNRAREQKEKDTGDSVLAGQWYGEKLKEAERQRQQTIREGQITEYNNRVQHNELLKELEGKTQGEIDRLNREELQKKLSYLDTELKQTELTVAEKVRLEQEMAATMQKSRELDSRDPEKAAGEAKRRLQERTTDYAAIMTEPFDRINRSMEQHFTAMLTGAESLSRGFKGIFQDMTTSVTNMMVKMWLNKMVMGPLAKWWGSILDSWFGGSGGSVNLFGDRPAGVLGPIGENGGFYKNYATTSLVNGWGSIGEAEAELINFSRLGAVYSANDTMLSKNNGAVKPISVQMHVYGVQNAESFRQSQGQIIASLGKAISSSVRRNT